MVATEPAGGLVGRDHGRRELPGQRPDGLSSTGAHRAAARPDQRTLGPVDQLERRAEVRLRHLGAPVVLTQLRVGLARLGQQQIGRYLEVDGPAWRQLRYL